MNDTFIDKNGLIKTHAADSDSGNGLLYSYLFYTFPMGGFDPPYLGFFEKLYDLEKGVLHRTPQLTYGNDSHDNYLGLALHLLETRQWFRAQCVFESAFFKGFYLKDVPFSREGLKANFLKEVFAPWLPPIRFPIPWLIMFAAAYPSRITHFVARILLTWITSLDRVDPNDASKTQLQFLARYGILQLGGFAPMETWLRDLKLSDLTWGRANSLAIVMLRNNYYEDMHPIPIGFDLWEHEFHKTVPKGYQWHW